MAGAGAIRAGKAYVEFFGDDSKLIRTMNGIDKKLTGWGKSVSAIGKTVAAAGLAVLTPLVGAAALFDSMGSALNDMALRTGASVEALSSFGFAAEQAGASLEDVETGLKKMGKLVFAAATGNKEAEASLRRLGLTVADLAKLAPEDQFRLIASRIAQIQNPTARAAMAMQVFGKTGTQLLPMISELAALEERARSLGLVMSTEDAQAADRLGDSWTELKAVGKALVFQVGAALAPMLTNLVTKAAETGAAFIQWARDNRELILTVAKIAGIVVAIGAAIAVLGGILTVAGFLFGALATIVSFCAGVVGALVSAFMFLISPVGLILASLVGLTVAFFKFTDMGQQALAFISDAFTNFSNEAVAAWQAIGAAIGNGDIAQALVVAGAFLTLQWAKITFFFKEQWNNFLTAFLTGAVEITKRVANVFIDMTTKIALAFLDMADALGKALGKDLIDPRISGLLRLALPMGAVGMKVAAGNAIDAAGGKALDAGKADIGAALDNKNKAQTDFEDAVKRAGMAGNKFNPNLGAGPVPDLRDGLEQAKTAVSGTFSAAAAAGLAGSSQLDKVADNTDDMKVSLRKIAAKPAGIGAF